MRATTTKVQVTKENGKWIAINEYTGEVVDVHIFPGSMWVATFTYLSYGVREKTEIKITAPSGMELQFMANDIMEAIYAD